MGAPVLLLASYAGETAGATLMTPATAGVVSTNSTSFQQMASALGVYFLFAANNGAAAGSGAITGQVTIPSSLTTTGGNVSVAGYLILQGTVNNSGDFNASVYAELNTQTAFTHTSGIMAPLISTLGASSALTSDTQISMLTLWNNTQCVVNSCIQAMVNCTYFLDVSNSTKNSGYSSAASGGTLAGKLKVSTPSGVMYIQLYSGTV
jgi:hypothetical protein